MSITTLKLFETLLTKSNEQIINSLVLSNLLGRSYVSLETIDSGHHSPTPGGTEDHHDNPNTVQGHSNEGQAEGHVKTNSENRDSTQSSSSTKSENKPDSSENGEKSGQIDFKEQTELKSELLNAGATSKGSSPKGRHSEVSEETSEKSECVQENSTKSQENGELSKVDAEMSQKDTELGKKETGQDNSTSTQELSHGNAELSKGDAESQRQRHHSDFENELDEILGRVSSSSSGGGDAAENDVISSSQTTGEEEGQLVSHQGMEITKSLLKLEWNT